MELAEATQREALRTLQPRPERPPPAPGTWMPQPPPDTRDATLTDRFCTLSRCVRQALLLEARLDSTAFDRPPPERTPAEPHASPTKPRTPSPGDGTALHYEVLEDDLAAEDHRAPDAILSDIAEKLAQALDNNQAPARPTPTAQRPSPKPPEPASPRRPAPPPDRRPPKPG